MSQHTRSGGTEVVGAVAALTTLLTVLLVAFAWPASEIGPHELPVAIAGPPSAAVQVEGALAQALGPDALDVTAVPSRQAAVDAIEDRKVYGAVVLSPAGEELLVASAASPAVAQLLGQLGERLAAATGTAPTVTDVVTLPPADPRGVVFAAGSFPLVLGGLAAAAILSLRLPGRGSRVAGAIGVAMAAGLALTAVLQLWLDALGGGYLANAGVVALAIGSIALVLVGLRNVLGLAGLGLGAAVVLLLGNPLSGITSAPELLPAGWGTLGQLLPPGAAGSALRSTAFFDGAGASGPLLVLAGWVAVGLVLAMVPVRRGAEREAARRTPEKSEKTGLTADLAGI